MTRVLRLGVGAAVDVFDGRGGLWHAVVDGVSRRAVTVRVGAPATPAPETRVRVRLVASVLKGDKMDEVVRDAVMLGVRAIVPVVSARSEATVAALVRGQRLARWQRVAVASAKQCGRAVVPDILEPQSADGYLAQPVDGLRLICVEPSLGAEPARSVHEISAPDAADLMIGPEGGWTPHELHAARQAGAVPVIIGRRTLRADAAPLVALAALLTTWGEL